MENFILTFFYALPVPLALFITLSIRHLIQVRRREKRTREYWQIPMGFLFFYFTSVLLLGRPEDGTLQAHAHGAVAGIAFFILIASIVHIVVMLFTKQTKKPPV